MADQIENHLKGRTRPQIEISDERGELLDTGGGVVKALPLLGDAPFFHMNSDTLWIEGVTPNLPRLAAQFDPARMDILLLLASTTASIGYEGRGDFAMAPDGRLRRRAEREVAPFVYAGAAVLVAGAVRRCAARANSRSTACSTAPIEAGRLHGLRLDGTWMHVGTPAAIKAAEAAILESVARFVSAITRAESRLAIESLASLVTGCRLRGMTATCPRASSPFRLPRRSCRR